MDEKSIVVPRGNKPRGHLWQRLCCLSALSILLCYFIYEEHLFPAWHPTRLIQGSSGITYPGEDGLIWRVCGEINGRKIEYTNLDVPMDQFNKTNSGDEVFNLPVIRLRGNEGAKNILFNPGGPGGSGVEFIRVAGDDLSTVVGMGYHLVSFDPRGVAGSKPQATCYLTKEDKQSLSRPYTYHPEEDSIQAYAWSKNFVQSCADSMGEHGKYINTPNTAADLNTIMDKLGQKEMFYWGGSYGTVLGQTYATIFPERSHRIIIDGVVNNFAWYDELMFDDTSLQDSEAVLYGFFDECIKAGHNCPLSPFAETAEGLQKKILDLANSFEEPLSVYVNNTRWGVIKPENIIINAMFSSVYRPARWWSVADKLANLLQGNATDAFLAWGGVDLFYGALSDESNTVIHNNDAPTGLDNYPGRRQDLLERLGPLINSSIFGVVWANQVYSKQLWRVPKTHSFKQKKSVKTAHPLLILSTTYDPVTPLNFAKIALATFQGSQLIEIEGYGHSSSAMPSKCAAKHIRSFLYNGTVPKEYTKCSVDGPYFINPENDPIFDSNIEQSDEDKALYRAQLRLAQDENWPYTVKIGG